MDDTNVMVDGIASRLDLAATFITEANPDQAAQGRGGFRALANLYQRASQAKHMGEPTAWVNFAVVPEVFWAMDIVPVYIDNTAGIDVVFPASPENVGKYIDTAHQYVPEHVCSANKSFMGAVLCGDIPKPSIFVHTSHPCDSAMAVYPVLCQSLEIPYYCIDVPYWTDERTFGYIAGELKSLISFLEDQTGRKMDYNKLRQVMMYSNQAHELILQLNELKKSVPFPYSSIDSLAEYPLFLGLAGTPELVEYCKRAYEVTTDIVDRKQGYLPEERIRLAWILAAAAFDISTFTYLEQVYGAISIHCVSNITHTPVEDLSSPDSMLLGLAHKLTTLPMGREFRGPWENNVSATLAMCRDYKADAAIFAGHIACKHNWATAKLLKDKISDEVGIPTFIFELDAFDPRVATPEVIKAQFDEFFQVNFPEVASSRPELPV